MMNDVEDKDVNKIFRTAESMVNCFGLSSEEIAEKLTEEGKENTVNLASAWVKFWSEQPEYAFDGRNEVAGRLCKEIANSEPFKELVPTLDQVKLKFFRMGCEEEGRRMHKTLMQSFSGFLFYILNEKLQVKDGKWYNLPLI